MTELMSEPNPSCFKSSMLSNHSIELGSSKVSIYRKASRTERGSSPLLVLPLQEKKAEAKSIMS